MPSSATDTDAYTVTSADHRRKVDHPAQFRVVDVVGRCNRAVSGTGHFEQAVNDLPGGPLKVTLRHEPNEVNPHAVAAYVDDRQVGWIGTTWSADAPELLWVKRLEAAHVRPRLRGELEVRLMGADEYVYIIFYMPYDHELSAVADELLLAEHGRGLGKRSCLGRSWNVSTVRRSIMAVVNEIEKGSG